MYKTILGIKDESGMCSALEKLIIITVRFRGLHPYWALYIQCDFIFDN